MSTAPSPDQVLARWRARENDLRSHNIEPGLGSPEQFAGRSGMQVFEAMLKGDIPPPPICETLDFLLVEAAPGHAEFQGQPLFEHYNPLGSVHGGWVSTLLDSALACAVHSLLPPGKTYTTIELKVSFIRSLTKSVPLVRAVADVIHLGGRIGSSHAKLVGPDDTLYAHAMATCLIMDANTK
jgi:uncharacterized protein (TIGR00369 family)